MGDSRLVYGVISVFPLTVLLLVFEVAEANRYISHAPLIDLQHHRAIVMGIGRTHMRQQVTLLLNSDMSHIQVGIWHDATNK